MLIMTPRKALLFLATLAVAMGSTAALLWMLRVLPMPGAAFPVPLSASSSSSASASSQHQAEHLGAANAAGHDQGQTQHPLSNLFAAHRTSDIPTAESHRVGDLPWADGEDPIIDSFAGTLAVRDLDTADLPAGNASIFYWFFPAQEPLVESPPLLIWLQGGPGSSSMIGLFNEMGPLRLTSDMRLARNPSTWNRKYAMLFIDSPVGTGFSFVGDPSKDHVAAGAEQQPLSHSWLHDSKPLSPAQQAADAQAAAFGRDPACQRHAAAPRDAASSDGYDSEEPKYMSGYAANQAAVALDLITFLDRFYQIYPDQLNAPLYITGESYAGKYIPMLAFQIDKTNTNRNSATAPPAIPLKGIAIGNGLTDPITQVSSHAPLALAMGLVSRTQAATLQDLTDASVGYLCRGDLLNALASRLRMYDLFQTFTGSINWYDIRKSDTPNDWSHMNAFLRLPATKSSLHLSSQAWFGKSPMVYTALELDIMKSAAGIVATLLDRHYKVLLYQGQFDFRDGIMSSSQWIESLQWTGSQGYLSADRSIWRTVSRAGDNHVGVVGYVTSHENLVRVELLNAGHLSPMDQPIVTAEMIDKWLIA